MEITGITDEEIDLLKNSKTEVEWNAICDKIKKSRNGHYPPDWWSKVKLSGIIDEAIKRFGSGELRVTVIK